MRKNVNTRSTVIYDSQCDVIHSYHIMHILILVLDMLVSSLRIKKSFMICDRSWELSFHY